jgi:CRISPR type I-E-associated protein CasB/Cse2
MISYDVMVEETQKRINAIRYCPVDAKQRAMLATLRNRSERSNEFHSVAYAGVIPEIMADAKAVKAMAIALSLYGLHQQGKDPKENFVCRNNISVGWATGRLVSPSKDNEAGVTRRFNQFATAESVEMVGEHLHGLIRQMRNADIGLDYAKLAGDLYLYQNAEKQSDVRLGWGMDYYRSISYYARMK